MSERVKKYILGHGHYRCTSFPSPLMEQRTGEMEEGKPCLTLFPPILSLEILLLVNALPIFQALKLMAKGSLREFTAVMVFGLLWAPWGEVVGHSVLMPR